MDMDAFGARYARQEEYHPQDSSMSRHGNAFCTLENMAPFRFNPPRQTTESGRDRRYSGGRSDTRDMFQPRYSSRESRSPRYSEKSSGGRPDSPVRFFNCGKVGHKKARRSADVDQARNGVVVRRVLEGVSEVLVLSALLHPGKTDGKNPGRRLSVIHVEKWGTFLRDAPTDLGKHPGWAKGKTRKLKVVRTHQKPESLVKT